MTEGELHYNKVARCLHWTIAALVIINLAIGLLHDFLPKGLPAMPVHKSIGLTVLALSAFRLFWRITHRPPPFPAQMPGWEKATAQMVHYILYALMFVMPMTGWIMSSAGDRPLNFFWLFDVPKFAVTKADPITGFSREAHEILGFTMAALVLGHIAAALRHHLLLRNNVLNRMLRDGKTAN